jgi:L-ascorbate metabolism protein UlaG (beta-lactamase superfamily)
MKKQFGGKITDDLLKRYSQSPHWREGKFMNLEETSMAFSLQALPKFLYKQFCKSKGREPQNSISVQPFDQNTFLSPSEKAKIIWYGHSVMLIRINEKTILIDPMFGSNSAPVGPFNIKRFSKNTLDIIDQLPPIDLLLLSHDHYDHLDLKSMEKLIPNVKEFFVALGCARHLIEWGVDSNLIQEFDWWDNQNFEGIDITFTPSRHFSGRGLKDRAKSLWGGWVLKTYNENIYFSGDGGYGTHFREVGEKLGPFDFGIMECGQYHENWHQIHMYPEEAIQAAIDAKANKVMAVHWGAFALAQHSWKEPIERFTKAASENGVTAFTPRIGELFSTRDSINERWWEFYE